MEDYLLVFFYLISGSRSSMSSMLCFCDSLQLSQIPSSSSSGASSSPQMVQYVLIPIFPP